MPGKRWMATIIYRDGTKPLFIEFEKIMDLHDSVERDPNRNSIEHIIVTPNRLPIRARQAFGLRKSAQILRGRSLEKFCEGRPFGGTAEFRTIPAGRPGSL